MRGKILLWAALALVLAVGCATPHSPSANYASKDDDCPECGEGNPGNRGVNPGRYAPPAAAASMDAVQGLGYRGPMPLRSAAKVMRVWMAPWESMDGALHMPTYQYAEVEERKWSIGERRMEVAPNITPLADRELPAAPERAPKPQARKPQAQKPGGKDLSNMDLNIPKENPNPAPTLDTSIKPKNASQNAFFDRKTGQVKSNNLFGTE